jgi:hypothetical protein
MDWQPMPAALNPIAHVSVPFYKLLFAFGIRFRVSPIPANQVAARAINIFTARFQATFWSRALSELHASGHAQLGVVYATVAELHVVIAALTLQNPNALHITANRLERGTGLPSCVLKAPAMSPRALRLREISVPSEVKSWTTEPSGGKMNACIVRDEGSGSRTREVRRWRIAVRALSKILTQAAIWRYWSRRRGRPAASFSFVM